MTKKVLEAQEKICDIAGGGAPGRVVCAMGVDAGDFAWADERGSANEIEVAVSPESHLSIGVICAGFWEMWPVLPIDQGLAATGRETWDPDVEMSQASVSELRRLVQAIAVTPAATVDEFMLKKEVVVECVNKYANGPASTLVLMSLFQDFDRLTDHRRSTPFLLNRNYSETSRIVSARHTLCDEDVFDLCQTFWVVWCQWRRQIVPNDGVKVYQPGYEKRALKPRRSFSCFGTGLYFGGGVSFLWRFRILASLLSRTRPINTSQVAVDPRCQTRTVPHYQFR